MATVFDKILDSTTGPKSYDWYRKKVQSMTTPGAKSLKHRHQNYEEFYVLEGELIDADGKVFKY